MDRFNQWLSLLANIGVVLGLIFLAVELNQNTRATITASSAELTNQSLQYFSLGMDNQVIARALHKHRGGEEINDFERSQLYRYQYFNFRVFENAYLQHRRGFYELNEWERYRAIISTILETDEIASEMWEQTSGQWTSEFETEINSIRSGLITSNNDG